MTDAMVAPVAVACVVIFLVAHFRTMGPDLWLAMVQTRILMPKDKDTLEETRMKERIEEGLLEVRQKTYVLCARLFVHVMAGSLLVLLKIYVDDPIDPHLWSLLVPSIVYCQHWLVGSGKIQPSTKQVRLLALCNYVQFATMPILDTLLQVPQSVVTEKFVLANRFVLTTAFLDTRLTAAGQLLFFIASVSNNLLGYGKESLGMNVIEESQIWIANLGLSAILEYLVCCRVRASLETAESTSLLSGFRRMLRGVCDGEVLLDHQLNVQGKAECLKHLLMNSSEMHGKDFQQLLMPEEHERFLSFLRESAARPTGPGGLETPPCLRLSFRSSMNVRVRADIFHVPVPQLLGEEKPYHLLAIREDVESRHHPECADVANVPEVSSNWEKLPGLSLLRCATAGGSHCSSVGSSSGASSAWQPVPELSQVMLMVDAVSPQLEVEQAHLSFLRGADSKASSALPALRELIRPTEWETVRGEVEQLMRSDENGRLHLRHVRFRLPDAKEYFVAERVEISMAGDSSKPQLLLHLEDFAKESRPSRKRPPSVLAGISESFQLPASPGNWGFGPKGSPVGSVDEIS